MTYIYIFSTLLIAFFLIRNCIAASHFKSRRASCIVCFDDTRKARRISRIAFITLFGLMLLFLAYCIFSRAGLNILQLSIVICLILCFALFGFVPYSSARWLVEKDGIYLYNQDRFIPWEELLSCRISGQGKKAYLQLDLIKTESDRLKKGTYMVQIPPDKARDTVDMIRDFINMENAARARRRRERLSST
ncbi:MAG: hypothetical protein J6P72_06380 [Firmicutes bacterium]|nr:hypothetical protein [Bacillota bacterium]